MGCGLLVWSIVTMAGSYMTTFETLLAFRCLGGTQNYTVCVFMLCLNAKFFEKELERLAILPSGQLSSVIFSLATLGQKCWHFFISLHLLAGKFNSTKYSLCKHMLSLLYVSAVLVLLPDPVWPPQLVPGIGDCE